MIARVAIIPSWFPNRVQPLFGSYVHDQVRALASTFGEIEWHVIAPDAPEEWLSLRRPIAGMATWVRSWQHARTSAVETDAANLFIHRVHAVQGSPALGLLGFGPYRRILEQSFKRVQQSFGRIDLVHVHGCYPAGLVVAAMRPSCPWVMTEHQSPFPFAELRGTDGSLWPELQAVFRAADGVVAVSRSHARDIEQFTGTTPTVIPNVCDEALFAPRTTRPAGPYTFLTVGGLNEQKGIDVLLRAIAGVASRGLEARFRIVGTGPLEAALHRQARELGVSDLVEWTGPISRSELPAMFQGADAFVLPSRHESFGVVYIEALASGLPIIATRCGGPEDIVRDGNGVLIPVGDAGALAEAMAAMLHASYDPMAIRQDFLERFSKAPVARRIMDLYESVL